MRAGGTLDAQTTLRRTSKSAWILTSTGTFRHPDDPETPHNELEFFVAYLGETADNERD